MASRTTETSGTAATALLGAPNQLLEQELLKLVNHSVWANSKWVKFVYSQTNPETRPRELLGHLVVGALIWFERIEGQQKTNIFFPVME